jgi:5-methylcytosine-specific restriction enzyme subunit McrC
MSIPVRNYYYLLCYAWDQLQESRVVNVDPSDYDHITNLFARILSGGLQHLLKRGLSQGYSEIQEVVNGVRGRIDFASSVKMNLFPLGRSNCVSEELTQDVVHNRIIKSTVRYLLRAEELDKKLHDDLQICLMRMSKVSNIAINVAMSARVQLHSNNGFYDFLLRICRLIHDSGVIDPQTGRLKFRDFDRDDRAMAYLFQRFVLNFFKREQSTYSAKSESLRWQDAVGDPDDLACLPMMITDVALDSPSRKIIIDAKYYREPMQRNFGKDSVRSAHLYQLFAYLKNFEKKYHHRGGELEGILLYPLSGKKLDLRFKIHGHMIRVVTIDLSSDWRQIHDLLCNLIS